MKKRVLIFLAAIVISAALTFSGCADEKTASSSMESEKSEIVSADSAEDRTDKKEAAGDKQKLLEEILEDQGFEGTVYAEQNGKTIASFSGGSLETGEEITDGTVMPLGSVSKQFCACAILLLDEQGKLSIDDTLDKYFPEYKDTENIKLTHLLSMRSGLPNYGQDMGKIVSVDKSVDENKAAVIKWALTSHREFKPGEKFKYTNTSYFLLSNIVEQVSGKKYIDFLRENFFTPLGMEHTGNISETVDSSEWSNGISYDIYDDKLGLTKGAGDIVSNAEDITTWMNALRSGRVISSKSLEAMITDYSPEADHYGYGMYLEINGGYGHAGAVGTYTAYDYINDDKDFTLFWTSNTMDAYSINTLLEEILSVLMD